LLERVIPAHVETVPSARERLRPPVQLADPIPRLEVWGACAGFELPILLRLHADPPRDLTDGEAAPLSIGTEEIGERSHGSRA
jgi:hypothetical protein